ncbi:MAG: RNA polymerase subunit sigma-24, partial [Ruminococcus sp.]|nr:RNA polymerase subunit sigma-24 [Ruminococcus sp.]
MYSGSHERFDDEYIRYVLDTYSAMLIRLCFSYVKNMHDAEDMAQDVFCELVKRRPVFDDENHERAWLLRCAVN